METLLKPAEPGQSDHSGEVDEMPEAQAPHDPMPNVKTSRSREEILAENRSRESVNPSQRANIERQGGAPPKFGEIVTKDNVDIRLQDKE